MKKVLFIVPFPKRINPSARFRVELYEDALIANGFECKSVFFWGDKESKTLYKKGGLLTKSMGLVMGFLRRFGTIFSLNKFDYVFVLREVTPLGPPIFEWIYAKVFKKKVIYDFDDAIWVEQAQGANAWVRPLKAFWKVSSICKWSYKISAGNQYLYNYAIQYNTNVIINPTCVDTANKHNVIRGQNSKRVVIGWTGSFSQLVCLEEVIDVLKKLDKKYDFEFVLIANRNPELALKNYTFLSWNEASEIEDLSKIDVGIMPLPDNELNRGKCGFKLIQYMALAIPVVASPVEVNAVIVDDGINGFLCKTELEWYTALETLILDVKLRREMGINGRKKIVDNYSLQSNKDNFLSLFK